MQHLFLDIRYETNIVSHQIPTIRCKSIVHFTFYTQLVNYPLQFVVEKNAFYWNDEWKTGVNTSEHIIACYDK